ncbi:hypothetical protein CPT_Machias_249 [Staphylococcus phage Machias]|nr:hypothetical protein CPT_Machias_249 [Staphylococcus phage Machias]
MGMQEDFDYLVNSLDNIHDRNNENIDRQMNSIINEMNSGIYDRDNHYGHTSLNLNEDYRRQINRNDKYLKRRLAHIENRVNDEMNRFGFDNHKPHLTYEQRLMEMLDEIRNKNIKESDIEKYIIKVSAILYVSGSKYIPEFSIDDIMNKYFEFKELLQYKKEILNEDGRGYTFKSIFIYTIWSLVGNENITHNIRNSISNNFLLKSKNSYYWDSNVY